MTEITGENAVLNSKTCNSSMSFLFQIASTTSAGSVTFLDAGDNLSGVEQGKCLEIWMSDCTTARLLKMKRILI